MEHRGEFFELSMRVIGLRRAPAMLPEHVEAAIKEAVVLSPQNISDDEIKPKQYVEIRLRLAETIRNDTGTFTVEVGGVAYPFPMTPNTKVPLGGEIDTLDFSYRFGSGEAQLPLKPHDLARRLTDKSVRIVSARNRPAPPTRDELLQDIRNQLNLIRLDAIRRR
ncbi:MAG: hypothetical protein L0Y71_08990 [Gemmataceae bacterium]|nr:hypothetical protein [Gemmataceae bacterium]